MTNAISAVPYTDTRPVPPTPHAPAGDAEAVREAARQFEAFFIGEFVETMFQGVGEDKMFGGGAGGEMFRSLLNREYANEMSKAGGIGIADAVAGELLRAQENAR
jgi:Rod binding domain-containing protein